MRILLDIRHRTTLSGAVSYVYNMLPGLVQAPGSREFVVLRYDYQSRAGALPCEEIILPAQSPLAQIVYDHTTLPRLMRRLGADLYHPLKYLGTTKPACQQITTLHAITESYKGQFPGGLLESIYWRHLGRLILRQSTHVIAVSAFIRDFLTEIIGIPERRTTVIPNGIVPHFHRVRVSAEASADEDYLLTVGNIFPVKNFMMAVRILAAVAADYPNLRLRMAGATDHPYCGQIRVAAAAAGVLDRIDFLGYVGADELVSLMNGCRMLLMPSLTEGCPVTLLEAMACGTPVIGSRRGGIPEIGGEAILLVDDPYDESAWIAAARCLLMDSGRRQQFSAAALERAKDYSWPRTVAATLAVYDSLGG